MQMITTPGDAPAVTGRTRRDIMGALGGAGLVAIAAPAFAAGRSADGALDTRPDHDPRGGPDHGCAHNYHTGRDPGSDWGTASTDAELIRLCAEFDALEWRAKSILGDGGPCAHLEIAASIEAGEGGVRLLCCV